MPRVMYLVCGEDEAGYRDAEGRGWVRVARGRFVTPERDDVRVVRRFSEMVPDPAGVTVFVRGMDLPERAVKGSEAALFEGYVKAGRARWV